MSQRFDSAWISSAFLFGDGGLGVLGSEVPSSGPSGAGYIYNDLTLPDDASKEVCGRITTWPTAGTLTAYEDSSFTFTGAPDGSYFFQYQLYVDGVATGSPATVDLIIGEGIIAVPAATLTLTAYAPTVIAVGDNAITVPAGALTLTAFAPTVSAGSGAGTGATAAEIWAYEIEPGVTAKMALQRIMAVLGGKVSGAGSGTETFRDINDTRDALISTNDSNGNRTGLTWNDGP